MSQPQSPSPSNAATCVFLSGLVISFLVQPGGMPAAQAHSAAIGIGASLLVSILIDYRRNLSNLVRTDIMALAALYFLTLFEFLSDQPEFDIMVNAEEAAAAIPLCYLAFAGIAIGRHWSPRASPQLTLTLRREFPPRLLLVLFAIAIIGGYLYQLASVNFDVVRWFEYSMAPRFSQPWGRGRLGDWRALLGEFGMVVNLAPPIAGIILARREDYSRNTLLLVGAGLLLALFSAFVGGTRNVLATYLATFTVAYIFSVSKDRKREIFLIAVSSSAALLLSTVFMLEFRNIGFRNYLDGARAAPLSENSQSVFVDYNLYVISKLTSVFPAQVDYLGLEIPYLALIRPIPRAMWSGKPEGMSVGIEDALGAEGLTLASSFVGEAYMSGGRIGVLITAMIFGMIFGWWNRFASSDNSPFGHLVFASGFFAAVISMRSMLVFTTAILPTIAAIFLGAWLLSRQPVRRVLQFDSAEEAEDHVDN